MSDFALVTSMDQDYYDFCGHHMLNSYVTHTRHLPLYLYNEEFDPDIDCYKQGWQLGKEFDDFVDRWQDLPRVVTFAKKAFSIMHAFENIDCKRLIWVDADCIFKKPLDQKFLSLITDDQTLSTHFGVSHVKSGRTYFSCETGFFIVNRQHRLFPAFADTYREIYVDDQIENLRRFFDGDVYGETVTRLNGPHMRNLSVGVWKTPIKHSELRDYLVHYKGKKYKQIRFSS